MVLEIALQQDLDLILGVEEPIEIEWTAIPERARLEPQDDQEGDDEDELGSSGEPDPWDD